MSLIGSNSTRSDVSLDLNPLAGLIVSFSARDGHHCGSGISKIALSKRVPTSSSSIAPIDLTGTDLAIAEISKSFASSAQAQIMAETNRERELILKERQLEFDIQKWQNDHSK